MTSKLQCPHCKSNSVNTTDNELICHGCGNREYLYDYANAYDNPMPQAPTPDITELEDRVGNLEAISAEQGSVPRQYHERLQQVQGEVAYLHNKIAEQPAKKPVIAKSTYKGLEIE